MRLFALALVIFGLSIYAWKDWYKSLCGLILLVGVLEHKDMPRTMFNVPGLNPWNLLFFIVLLAWLSHRRREGLRWDMPRVPAVLFSLGLIVLVVGFARLLADTRGLGQDTTIAGLVSEYLFNPVKWVVVGLLLFDGCRDRRRLVLGLASILALYFLISLQVIRWVVPSGALQGGELSSYTIRTLQREIGYHRNDLSAMLAGASWACLAMLPLVLSLRGRAGLVLAGLVVMFAQVLTGGRGGYLAWCAVGLTLALVRWRRYLLLAPLIVILFLSLVPSAADRVFVGIHEDTVTGSEDVDLEELTAGRNLLWPRVIETISEAPFIGYGRAAMQRTGLSAWWTDLQGDDEHYINHPHNAYLETMLDSGVVGLLVVLALYGYLAAAGLSLVRDRRSAVFPSVGGFAVSLILALLVASFTGQSLYPREATVGMWCATGLMLRVSVQRSRASAASLDRKRDRGPGGSAESRIFAGATVSAQGIRPVRQDTPSWRSEGNSVR